MAAFFCAGLKNMKDRPSSRFLLAIDLQGTDNLGTSGGRMEPFVSYQRARKEKDELIFHHIQQRQHLSLCQQCEIHTHELEIELLRQDIRDYHSMRTDKHSRLREEYREISESPERPRATKQDQDHEEDRGYQPEI
jgi:hypothetical protein